MGMCGPAKRNENEKTKRDEFLDDVSDKIAWTICDKSEILSPSPSIFDGRLQDVPVSVTRRNGSKKNSHRWKH
jgi:hypothetical protein